MVNLKTFRLMAVRLSLLASAIAAFAGFKLYGPIAAKGVLAGGLTGVIVFWAMALQLEKVASGQAHRVKQLAMRWMLVRVAAYFIVLYWFASLDRVRFHGMIGAAVGLLLVHGVLLLLGLTGWDLKQGNKADGKHR